MSDITTIPKGSLVLVTGATGYIGSQIISNLLERGYKVRGTVRDLQAASWVSNELFPKYAASGAFELAEVRDLAAPGAFDEAVKGVSGVVHVATIGTLSPNPNEIIPQTVQGALSALEAAAKEPLVKSFVFTTSLVAMALPLPGVKFHVDSNSWNEIVGPMAWAPAPYDPSRAMIVYMQSKVEAEKAVWKFVEEKKPSFHVNTVSPTSVFGKVLHPKQWTTTPGWIRSLWNGEADFLKTLPALNFVHVRDVANLHVAALLDTEVNGQRVQAFAQGFNWNDVLAIFRKVRPDRKFIDDLPGMQSFLATTDDSLSLKLLKKWNGQESWLTLEDGIKEMAEELSG